MKNKLLFAVLSAFITFAVASSAFAEPAHMRRIKLATELVNKMAIESDADALANVIKHGKGVAIFPKVTKAGLGVLGGQTGEGLVLLRNPNGTWSGPAFMGINGASAGLQIGVSSIGLVLVITNEKGLRAFTGDNSFKLGADVGVAAGPVGRDTQAATDGRLKASIYSYSMSEGLFAGITAEGCVINQNRDANKAYWGKALSPAAALKRKANDKRITPLVKALKKLIAKSPD